MKTAPICENRDVRKNAKRITIQEVHYDIKNERE